MFRGLGRRRNIEAPLSHTTTTTPSSGTAPLSALRAPARTGAIKAGTLYNSAFYVAGATHDSFAKAARRNLAPHGTFRHQLSRWLRSGAEGTRRYFRRGAQRRQFRHRQRLP